MTKRKTKKIASPYSTGGGGGTFEHKIQAAFLTIMLSKGLTPCFIAGTIEKVSFQAKSLGYQTDDLVVFSTSVAGGRRKLLCQVKHEIRITEKDQTLSEVIHAAWDDFNNEKLFNQDTDAFALITGPLSRTDMEVRQLLEWARACLDESEFITKVNLANYSSENKRTKLDVLRSHLSVANQGKSVTNEQLWRFLKSFHLLNFDLDLAGGVNLSVIQTLISQFNRGDANGVWSQIYSYASDCNNSGATVSADSVPEYLRELFVHTVGTEMPVDLEAESKELTGRKKAGIDWSAFSQDELNAFAIAQLIGKWSENSENDKKIIESICGENYDAWISKIRNIHLTDGAPLTFGEGVWEVKDRMELWKEFGKRLYDSHLSSFQSGALEILSECNPAFELPPEERYAANIHGKILSHSKSIRKGISDTLAILAVDPDSLGNCSRAIRNHLSDVVVRETLSDADWTVWASLNPLLPIIAEASPKEFLGAVEAALAQDRCPFVTLYEQEGKGFSGGDNYMTGLLWGLEGLAWNTDHLNAVTVVLGGLDAIDPGGNWANRARNSLTEIFLPWINNSTATIENRKSALLSLSKEYPETAWKLLVSLLPGNTRTSTNTHRPAWRDYIPEDWKKEVSQKDYREYSLFCADFLMDIVESDASKIPIAIKEIDHLSEDSSSRLVEHLRKLSEEGVDSKLQFEVWDSLNRFIRKHKRFRDAKWSLPSSELEKLDEIHELYKPNDLKALYLELFSGSDHELYEERGNYQEQRELVRKRKQEAVVKLFDQIGFEGLTAYAQEVSDPRNLGYMLGTTIGSKEQIDWVKPLLNTDEYKLMEFIGGYIVGRYEVSGRTWLDELDADSIDTDAKVLLLLNLPYERTTWDLVSSLLKEHESLYWQKVAAHSYWLSPEDAQYACKMLLKCGREISAIDCVYRLISEEKEVELALLVECLKKAVGSTEKLSQISDYEIQEAIEYLQNHPDADEEDLFQIEWAYLPLLDEFHKNSPIHLERQLAKNPRFFCDLIRRIFRSKKDKSKKPATESEQKIATNAYSLLGMWKTIPGMDENGVFDSSRFVSWIEEMIEICTESGHLEVALSQLGQMLIHAPADPNGLWIHESVANVLNRKDLGELRHGFQIGESNSRGVHWVDPTGKPEYELAAKYTQQAQELDAKGYQRLATTMRSLGERYKQDAERIIEEHRKDEDQDATDDD